MKKTNIRLTHFMIETKLFGSIIPRKNINLFMVKVDKKKRKYIWLYTFLIINHYIIYLIYKGTTVISIFIY